MKRPKLLRLLTLLASLVAVAGLATRAQAQNPPPGPPPGGPPASSAPQPAGAPPKPAPGQPPPGVVGGPPPQEIPGEDNDLYKCKKYPTNVRIKVALKPDTDLKELVAWAMGFTCKGFIYGNAISGRAAKVTMIAPAEMSPQDAYRLFYVALQSMGLTVVPKGNTLEIVESSRSKDLAVPVYRGRGAPNVDQIVRVVLRPEHISTDDLTQVLNSMKSSTGQVTPVPNAGVVIVTDYGSNIDRMSQVMHDVDASTGGEKIWMRPLQYADAQQVVSTVSDLFGVGKGGGAAMGAAVPGAPPGAPRPGGTEGGRAGSAVPSKIMAEQRTNSVIVVASDRAWARVKPIIDRLDTGGEGEAAGTIHVYYLSNADAEELGTVLNSLITGQAQPRPGGAGGPGGQPGGPGRTGVPQGGAVVTTAAGGAAFEGQVKITHDKTTNSLVIISSIKDFLSLRDVIRKLDIARRQVFVEAAILEVSIDQARRIGVGYHGGAQFDLRTPNDSLAFGAVESKQLSSLSTNPLTLDGFFGGALGPALTFPGITIPSLGVLFQIVQTSNMVNVLSSPNILTTDNQPAEINVGQNIPYQSGSLGSLGVPFGTGTTGTTTTPTPSPFGGFGFGQQIARENLTLKLKITPHVNESDFVRLELEQETKDLLTENFANLGPSWSTRNLKTTIVVKDQQPVVIGGLMSDKFTIEETKVPLLGDIPILGYLFKYSSKKKQKTNLLVILTPYIIKDMSDLQRIYERKIRERHEFIETYTSFEDREMQPDIDYRRKHGLLEDINQAIARADEDERMLIESQQQLRRRVEEGPVEMTSPTEQAPASQPAVPPPPPPKKKR